MTNPKIPKIAHNAKYDTIVLARHGLDVSPITFDTMIAEFLVDPASHNFGLKTLAFTRLGEEMTHIEQLIGTGKHQLSMAEIAIEAVAPYAAADAETTLRLLPIMQKELKRVNGERLMEEIEMPLIRVLVEMERTGVLLDLPFFKKLSDELTQRMDDIEKQVFEAVGKNFNLNSTQQLSDILLTACGWTRLIGAEKPPAVTFPPQQIFSTR